MSKSATTVTILLLATLFVTRPSTNLSSVSSFVQPSNRTTVTTLSATTSSRIGKALPAGAGSEQITTDKTTYFQLDTINYTGSGFTPEGAIGACITTDDDLPPLYSVLCVGGEPNADEFGNVNGSFIVGTNVPVGPQKFFVQDLATNSSSAAVQLTILANPAMLNLIFGFTTNSSGSVLLVVGDISLNPHGPKPSGVGYQAGRDTTPIGFLSGMLLNNQPTVYDTNTGFVNGSTGRPLTGSYSTIFVVGGPDVNAASYYYQTTGVDADRAPVSSSVAGSNYVWTDRNGTQVLSVPQSSNAVPPGKSDVFTIEILHDSGERQVVLMYGTTYLGTWAAAYYFKYILYPNIATYTNGYYIIRWTDATTGLSANGIPDSGDTYTILATAPS